MRMSSVRLTWLIVCLFILLSQKVSSPSPFSFIKGALDGSRPVVTRNYGEVEVYVSVMPLANIVLGGGGDDGIDQ